MPRGDTDSLVTMILGPHNPFDDEYVRKEIRWYHHGDYDKDGIRLVTDEPKGALPDYFNKNFRIGGLKVPILFIDGRLWMSLTPMEIQSQFLAILKASGDVGVAGLGMGYAALKMAQSEEVDSVTVFEIDPRIIEFFRRAFCRRKGFNKISFVEGDARETLLDHQFDFLYVDIYPTMLPDEIITDIKLFSRCVHEFPDGYHFWGQERILLDSSLSFEIISPQDLPFQMRALLTRWLSTPVSKRDGRLSGINLSDMYYCVIEQEYAENVLNALGML